MAENNSDQTYPGWMGKPLKKGQFPQNLNWNTTEYVAVSSPNPNICGHALLYVGGGFGGHYFHVPGGFPYAFQKPLYFKGSDFEHYLKAGEKKLWARVRLAVPRPTKAEAKLRELMQKPLFYFATGPNCVTFIEDIVRAGGNFENFYFCPALDSTVPCSMDSLMRDNGFRETQCAL